ncbi:MAG: polyribonucleotide nucleotidyltransferase [Chlamydiae bacterium]|nr:polyribonucleotide nucleotidyltransferase [Chlamydiota bacterium]MBI3265760.1 polyribonucleotide nucleotidyltransferase [Chlamydiota bacterium]
MTQRLEVQIGKEMISVETGRMAKQAHGAVTVQMGETIVLVAAVVSSGVREGTDFFPLTVDYREKTSAAGRFPGGYIKREGRQTEKEILTARLTDRPLRPLFPEGFFNEVQITSQVISADEHNDPDILSIIGASAALHVSEIPFSGPVGAVRVGLKDGKWIINPTYAELKESELDLVVAGTQKAILMVEGSAHEISENQMVEALRVGHEEIKKLTRLQEDLRKKCGKTKKDFPVFTVEPLFFDAMKKALDGKIDHILVVPEKRKREENLGQLYREVKEILSAQFPEVSDLMFKEAFAQIEKMKVRRMIVEKGIRNDGRSTKEVRPITCEVGILPRTHGSALFTRGETQALAVATLGTVDDEQRTEGFEGETSKSFMLHYNFPAFSVGEVKPSRGPGRREIGHGALAERSLLAILPSQEAFPYTIRLVSDILESNGSSSMATVCGGALALMDAGVPVKAPVAGVAMGLIQESDKTVVLTDILGSEDHLGDMDFKVAGTSQGITGFQMDLKIEGLEEPVLKKALEEARVARLHVLNMMEKAIAHPREKISEHAPRIVTIKINPEKIGLLIGPGGKTIKKIIEETQTEINIEDDGSVAIASPKSQRVDAAIQKIKELTAEVEVGKIYKGTVKNIMEFGAFVEVLPGKEGLVHISQLAEHRVKKVEDVLKTGDTVMVKVIEIDERGRINLSRKAVLAEAGSSALALPSDDEGSYK